MIDVGSLQALVAVERHGTVAAAAAALGFSPSAVSQQIKKLERQTGSPVLERRGRGVLLTERGLALAAYGRKLIAELEELQSTLLTDPARPQGRVRVVSFSTACRGLVGPMLGALAAAGTGIEVTVLAEDPREAVARVAAAEADLGIVHDWSSVPLMVPEHLVLEWICEDVADLLVHRSHPLASRSAVGAADMVDERWISTSHGAICNEALLRIFADVGRVPEITVFDSDFATHIALVEQAAVVALVPRLGRPALPEQVVAVPVTDPVPARRVGLVHRRTMTASPGIQHIAGLLRDIAGHAARQPGAQAIATTSTSAPSAVR